MTLPGHVWLMVCHGCQVSSELGSTFNDVIAAQDVALYGGLCALASLDRPDLRRNIIDNVSFRELLELNPEVRDLTSANSSRVLPTVW